MKHIGGRNMKDMGGDGEEEIFDGKNVSLNRQHTVVSPHPFLHLHVCHSAVPRTTYLRRTVNKRLQVDVLEC